MFYWMGEWFIGWMNECMNGWMNERRLKHESLQHSYFSFRKIQRKESTVEKWIFKNFFILTATAFLESSTQSAEWGFELVWPHLTPWVKLNSLSWPRRPCSLVCPLPNPFCVCPPPPPQPAWPPCWSHPLAGSGAGGLCISVPCARTPSSAPQGSLLPFKALFKRYFCASSSCSKHHPQQPHLLPQLNFLFLHSTYQHLINCIMCLFCLLSQPPKMNNLGLAQCQAWVGVK